MVGVLRVMVAVLGISILVVWSPWICPCIKIFVVAVCFFKEISEELNC